MSDEFFTSLLKGVRGLPQKCNRCGVIAKMKDTNLCDDCNKSLDNRKKASKG